MQEKTIEKTDLSFEDFKKEVIQDYKTAVISRECSLLGRREVLTGKAKFGIFGDGKEVPQLAMAKAFKNGDFRSGYYRDQTFMMALDLFSVEEFFAGLYGNTNLEKEPMAGGRQMGGHFGTQSLQEDGTWKNLAEQKNSSADISPTAGQMPRLLGLAQASKIYRNVDGIDIAPQFSDKGNEIAWGTIGNASTSEGLFWETINAAGVMQVPMVISVWDDEYGISVPAKYQTTKENISEILKGFQRDENGDGYEIIKVKGWNYPELMEAYQKASKISREEHVPVLIHVYELTQPQGHSTSGSHERYKSEDRLSWEREYDCNVQMRQWMLESDLATEEELKALEKEAKKIVREGKKAAWNEVTQGPKAAQKEMLSLLDNLAQSTSNSNSIQPLKEEVEKLGNPEKHEILRAGRKALRYVREENTSAKSELINWIDNY
ncbi:MAG: thiamine pyrophosphate-dependent dehydrogenase E1 component subunit alpha, partial [Mesonia sp.]